MPMLGGRHGIADYATPIDVYESRIILCYPCTIILLHKQALLCSNTITTGSTNSDRFASTSGHAWSLGYHTHMHTYTRTHARTHTHTHTIIKLEIFSFFQVGLPYLGTERTANNKVYSKTHTVQTSPERQDSSKRTRKIWQSYAALTTVGPRQQSFV